MGEKYIDRSHDRGFDPRINRTLYRETPISNAKKVWTDLPEGRILLAQTFGCIGVPLIPRGSEYAFFVEKVAGGLLGQ